MTFRPAIDDRQVSAIDDPTSLNPCWKALRNFAKARGEPLLRKSDHRQCRLLPLVTRRPKRRHAQYSEKVSPVQLFYRRLPEHGNV